MLGLCGLVGVSWAMGPARHRVDWCRLGVKGYEGWLKRTEIWGVNPTENFKE